MTNPPSRATKFHCGGRRRPATGEMGRILALDVGDRRIGVAVSDPTRTIASSRGRIVYRHKKFATEPEYEM